MNFQPRHPSLQWSAATALPRHARSAGGITRHRHQALVSDDAAPILPSRNRSRSEISPSGARPLMNGDGSDSTLVASASQRPARRNRREPCDEPDIARARERGGHRWRRDRRERRLSPREARVVRCRPPRAPAVRFRHELACGGAHRHRTAQRHPRRALRLHPQPPTRARSGDRTIDRVPAGRQRHRRAQPGPLR